MGTIDGNKGIGRWIALAVLSSLFGCTAAPPPREIRVGVLATLEGIQKETSGMPSIRGAQLAVDDVNERGGVEIDGQSHRVTLIVKGYEDRPDSAASVARALINQERIDALIGPQFSRHAIAVATVAENARIPMLSPMSSNPATTDGKEFVFRLAFLDDVQGAVMGEFAAVELEAKRAAILYDHSTAYGRDLAAVFRTTFEANGGQVVAFESYPRDAAAIYSEQMERIRDQAPEVLYLPNDTQFVRPQIEQARSFGIEATVLGGDTWDVAALKSMPGVEGAFVAHQWHRDFDTPEARRFVEHYEQENSEAPRVTAAMTFDAVTLLLESIERTGSLAPDAIRDALKRTKNFRGATGVIHFDGKTDPDRSVAISEIRHGESTLFRVVDP